MPKIITLKKNTSWIVFIRIPFNEKELIFFFQTNNNNVHKLTILPVNCENIIRRSLNVNA